MAFEPKSQEFKRPPFNKWPAWIQQQWKGEKKWEENGIVSLFTYLVGNNTGIRETFLFIKKKEKDLKKDGVWKKLLTLTRMLNDGKLDHIRYFNEKKYKKFTIGAWRNYNKMQKQASDPKWDEAKRELAKEKLNSWKDYKYQDYLPGGWIERRRIAAKNY